MAVVSSRTVIYSGRAAGAPFVVWMEYLWGSLYGAPHSCCWSTPALSFASSGVLGANPTFQHLQVVLSLPTSWPLMYTGTLIKQSPRCVTHVLRRAPWLMSLFYVGCSQDLDISRGIAG